MLIVIIHWFVDAHKWFKGPKVRLCHHHVQASGYGLLTDFATRSTLSIICMAERVMCLLARKWVTKTAVTPARAVFRRRIGILTISWLRILLKG